MHKEPVTHLEGDRKPISRISNGDHKARNPSKVTKLHEPEGKAVVSIPALEQQESHYFGGEAASTGFSYSTA